MSAFLLGFSQITVRADMGLPGFSSATPISRENCKSVDLSHKFCSVRNQGYAQFCYSFSDADILSEACGVNPPDSVSAMQIGALYISMDPSEVPAALSKIQHPQGVGSIGEDPYDLKYDPRGKPLLKREGGYPDLLLAYVLGAPKICLENEVPSEIVGKKYTDQDEQNFFMVRLGELAGGDDIEVFIAAKKTGVIPACLEGSPLLELQGTLKEIKPAIQDYAAQRLRDEINTLCKHPISCKNVSVHSFPISPLDPKSKLQIASTLGESKRPIVLSYNSCVLTNDCQPLEIRRHASILAAQKWRNNRCEVKIRNSWGKDCEKKRKGIDCKAGQWWVGLDELMLYSDKATWLERD